MSETSKVTKATSGQRNRLYGIIIAAIVIVPLLGYLGGYLMLPGSIKSAYQTKNCEAVLGTSSIYTSLYPFSLRDKNIANLVDECAVFTVALANAENKAWRDSYHAFQVYSELYQQGQFSVEAYEHRAAGLMSLAKEGVDQKQYAEAIGSLNIILMDYKDTAVATEADDLFPEIYTAWGTDLRATSDFAGAERTFNDFKTWAGNAQQTEHAKSAQYELAQTYLAWGTDLQSQQRFDDAQAKFDLAVSLNPGFAEQIQAGQMELYREQGDYLIEQGDFSGAMERYETAAALSKSDDPAFASDIIANGYIRWVSGLMAEEDYLGALVLLDFAQANAAADSTKTMVDTARSDLYLAFSRSKGEQAQKAIQDAVRIVCEHRSQPRLPIFGLDKENVLVGMYGIGDTQLPENLVATTPAALHRVVCIEETVKVVASVKHSLYASAAGFQPYLFERLQYTWTVTLRKTDTGEETANTTIDGAEPPPFPITDFEIYSAAYNGETQYRGPKPDFAELVNWLLAALQ